VSLEADSDPRDAANRLNASIVISGSVRQSGDDFRITTHLMDSVSGRYLWSESIDRRIDDVFAVQEEIAAAVAEKLSSELSGPETRRVRATREIWPPITCTCRAAIIWGSERRRASPRGRVLRKGDCRRRTKRTGLLRSGRRLRPARHYGVLSPTDVWTKIASNAAWAVTLNDSSAEAHTSLPM